MLKYSSSLSYSSVLSALTRKPLEPFLNAMATFAKGTFDFARYAAARPTYPRQLYDFVFKYHERSRGAKWDLAVDLGCGTG